MTRLATLVPSPPPAPEEPRPSRAAGLATLGVLAGLLGLALASGKGVYALGALGFLVALLVSVVLHEGGHFLTARRYGMKATQFFVGFGPTLWSFRRGETEYGVKAIPAGGFVKIVGMTPLEDVEPGDEDRAFYKAPVRQKVVVLAAGSVMHLVVCALLVVGGTFALGAVREQAPEVGAVSSCIVPDRVGVTEVDPTADPCTLPGARPAPAAEAGLRAGDVVTGVDGRAVQDSAGLVTALRASAGREVVLTVLRDGQRLAVPVTPAPLQRFARHDDGSIDVGRLETVGTVGISPRPRIATERLGPVESLQESGTIAVAFLEGIRTTVTEKLGTITKLYSDDRDPEGFIGIVGAGRISGEVLESEETAGVKALSFVLLVASLNLFVGLFNLLPLLPLDGGHIAVAVYEGLRDRVRRLRGYTGPLQRVDYEKLMPLTYTVALAFLGLTLFIVGADIVNPIRLQG